MAPTPHVWVLCSVNEDDEVILFEAHVSSESAEVAVKTYTSDGYVVEAKMLELKSEVNISATAKQGKAGSKTKKSSKTVKNSEAEEDGDELDDEESSSPRPAKDSRKTIPDVPGAKAKALHGLRLLFIGTMDIDRKTLEATAAVYGGLAVRKVEDSDYAVVGARPAASKLEAVNKHGLDKLTEAEFFDMIRTGVPEEKRERMAAREEDERPNKKPKKK